MALQDYEESDEEIVQQKTVTVTIENPEKGNSDITDKQYKDIRIIREELAVDLDSLVGEFFRGIVQWKETGITNILVELLNKASQISYYTHFDNSHIGRDTQTTRIRFRNARMYHTTMQKTDNEHLYYEAGLRVRHYAYRDLNSLVGMFCSAIVDLVHNGSEEKIDEVIERVKDIY